MWLALKGKETMEMILEQQWQCHVEEWLVDIMAKEMLTKKCMSWEQITSDHCIWAMQDRYMKVSEIKATYPMSLTLVVNKYRLKCLFSNSRHYDWNINIQP